MSTYGATTVAPEEPVVPEAVGVGVADDEADADDDAEADAAMEGDVVGSGDPEAPDTIAQLRPLTVHEEGVSDDRLTGWPMRPKRAVAPGASDRDQLGPDAVKPVDVELMVASQMLLTLDP